MRIAENEIIDQIIFVFGACRLNCGFNSAEISGNDGDILSGAYRLRFDDIDFRSLDHLISCRDAGRYAFELNHSDCSAHYSARPFYLFSMRI